jgi:YD repeat-containing protein
MDIPFMPPSRWIRSLKQVREEYDHGYGYDNMGNLTNVTYPINPPLAFSYNSMNWLTSMSDGIGTTAFSYTKTGQLQSESGPWASDTVTYTYFDQLRTELDLQQPNGPDWVQSYGYDAANRMTNITSPAGSFTYSYNPGLAGTLDSSSLVQKIVLPNGAFITNTYDSNARMLGTWLYNNNRQPIAWHVPPIGNGARAASR